VDIYARFDVIVSRYFPCIQVFFMRDQLRGRIRASEDLSIECLHSGQHGGQQVAFFTRFLLLQVALFI
jgi:hypothetical protein